MFIDNKLMANVSICSLCCITPAEIFVVCIHTTVLSGIRLHKNKGYTKWNFLTICFWLWTHIIITRIMQHELVETQLILMRPDPTLNHRPLVLEDVNTDVAGSYCRTTSDCDWKPFTCRHSGSPHTSWNLSHGKWEFLDSYSSPGKITLDLTFNRGCHSGSPAK